MKRIVVPGELVSSERKRTGEHVFLMNGKIYSDVLGIVDDKPSEVSVVPLEGAYVPKRDDVVVGIITAEKATGYMVSLNTFQQSFVSKKDVREQLKPGYVITARVMDVNELKEADISQVRVFYGGEIISVSPVKIPRVIGKNASMLEVLKRGTNSTIIVGRNGWIWAKGGNISLLVNAVKKIEREAHLENLTLKLQDFINQSNKSVKAPIAKPGINRNGIIEGEKQVKIEDSIIDIQSESDFNGS